MTAFSRALERFGTETAPEHVNGRIRLAAKRFASSVVGGSPVETGAFAGAWDVGIASYPATMPRGTGKQSSLGRIMAALNTIRGEKIVEFVVIQNLQPYAAQLEFSPGFRRDGQTGWVRAAVAATAERLKS